MKKSNPFLQNPLLMIVALSAGLTSFSQSPEKIKFSKSVSDFYFFQKGSANDTISKNRSDLFYLVVPDSMKPGFSISLENGRLIKTQNDSLFQLEYMPGLKYETIFVKAEFQAKGKILYEAKTHINGVSNKEKKSVGIRIDHKKEDQPLLENTFFYTQ